MVRTNVLAVIVGLLCLAGVGPVQAASFDFEAPAYVPGLLTGNGWEIIYNYALPPLASHADITIATANPYEGDQYLNFAAAASDYFLSADHALASMSTGVVTVEYANYYLGPGASSGKLMLKNTAADDFLIGVGVDNRKGVPNWLVAHGAGGTNRITGLPLPTAGWFLLKIELDLDSDTADVMWRQTAADPWSTIMSGYATNDFVLDSLRLENRKEAVAFDSISIVPEPLTIALLTVSVPLLAARRRRK